MSAEKQRSYRFSTEAQWNECLLVAVDHASLLAKNGVRPFAPFARPATRLTTDGGFAPAVTPAGETLWRDGAGNLYRLSTGQDPPEVSAAPAAVARAGRIVANAGGLWVAGTTPGSLERFDTDSLTRELTVALPASSAIDIASDGRGGVLALIRADDEWQVAGYDQAGRPAPAVVLTGISDAAALVFLRRSGRFVVLDADRAPDRRQPRLLWFAPAGGAPLVSVAVAGLRPCFTADALGSDGRERVFLAGTEHGDAAASAHAVIFDEDGNTLGEVPLDASATGIVATRDSLLVTDAGGVSRFSSAEVVPDGATQVECFLATPALDSPDRADQRRWLRVEASATLPAGSTITIDFAATDKLAVRDRLNALTRDASTPAGVRARKLFADPDLTWRGATQFHGSEAAAADGAQPSYGSYAAKLFDVSERYLWVRVSLTASPGGRLPVLSQLDVLYPGHTLMQNLPAIYQREESDPTSFLRALVGVLESTTQGLDQRIAAMGSRINPETAQGPWLDFVARWLGVPWDDGLADAQKQAILRHAEELTQGRGTRAGLETLLACLLPGTPPRFRVTDATADFGFAVVGGGACAGSALPVMLGGRTRWSAELDSRAVLDHMRLPCPGQRDDGTWRLAGRVRIEVAATAAEREAWQPWLLALINDMMPVTARAQLRWVSKQALRSHRLDGTFKLEPAPAPHLGTDAVTGLARLPDAGTRLSASGSSTGIRLV